MIPKIQKVVKYSLNYEFFTPGLLLILGIIFCFVWGNSYREHALIWLCYPYVLIALVSNQVTTYFSQKRKTGSELVCLFNLLCLVVGVALLFVGPKYWVY